MNRKEVITLEKIGLDQREHNKFEQEDQIKQSRTDDSKKSGEKHFSGRKGDAMF